MNESFTISNEKKKKKKNEKKRKKGIVLTNVSQMESNNSDANIFENNDYNWLTNRKNLNNNSAKS